MCPQIPHCIARVYVIAEVLSPFIYAKPKELRESGDIPTATALNRFAAAALSPFSDVCVRVSMCVIVGDVIAMSAASVSPRISRAAERLARRAHR